MNHEAGITNKTFPQFELSPKRKVEVIHVGDVSDMDSDGHGFLEVTGDEHELYFKIRDL